MKPIIHINKSLAAIAIATGIYTLSFAANLSDTDIQKETLDALAGGAGTVNAPTHDAFSLPAKNISSKHRIDFVVGNAFFKENWVASPSSVSSRQGLGPLLNAQSCSSCHFKDGRAAPPMDSKEIPVGLLLRLSTLRSGKSVPVKDYGDQLQHRAITGIKSEASFFVSYNKSHTETYADGTKVELVKPEFRFADLKFGNFPEDLQISPRVGPHLAGLGLLEAIDEKDIVKYADPDDLNKDGISGKPNRVWDVESKKFKLGRFGWKANQPSLLQQNAGALSGDMGISSPLFPDQNCSPSDQECMNAHSIKTTEISKENLRKLTLYTKTLAVPMKRNTSDTSVLSGAKSFHKIGCAQCHVSSYTTGTDPKFPENSQQKIYPYTDLLLHDMGDGLADNRPDFDANGREWRTPPLWGVGLFKSVNNHTRYLHDGRARSLEEAILWHGGESENSKQQFKQLSAKQRSEVIKFLESI